SDAFENYEFDKAAQSLYHFIWGEFCDWYIELSKFSLYSEDIEKKKISLNVLLNILINSLLALHPITPFITEEIFQILKNKNIDIPGRSPDSNESILNISYPEYDNNRIFEKEYKDIEFIKNIVVGSRNLRAIIGIHPSEKVSVVLNPENDSVRSVITENLENIMNLAALTDCVIGEVDTSKKTISDVVPGVEIIMPVEGLIDVDKEISRLTKELNKVAKDLEKTNNKLNNKNFIDKAPEEIIEKEKSKFEEFKGQKVKLEEILYKLSGL
ncbi:MAG: class I tRNA ligase family protein, partial [Candidatus Dadabacteria bacterium]|nr:class I tRNA ligase family protein [Candidatus Dadabacteria bacterium]NIQ14532.1 class I tRNA ligase family protein [Candidatus Dadabacteria bacterium]